jgi:hypothetical protein
MTSSMSRMALSVRGYPIAIMIGSAEELIEKILDAHQLLGLDRFYGQFDWGGLPRTVIEDSLHYYATQIAPQVRNATAANNP